MIRLDLSKPQAELVQQALRHLRTFKMNVASDAIQSGSPDAANAFYADAQYCAELHQHITDALQDTAPSQH